MAAQTPGRSIAWLCVKFAVLAPICLVLWLLVLPAYTWVLGHATALVLTHVLRYTIEGVTVTAAGVLNTGTSLTYVMPGVTRTMDSIGHLVTNIAPFIALVLATTGLGVWRRFKIAGIGIAVIFLFHAVTIILRFVAADKTALPAGLRTSLPTAIGFIAITLPFLLWIVLAYWDKVIAYFADTDADSTQSRPPQSS